MSLAPIGYIQGYGVSIDEEISRQLGVIWNIRDLFLQACQSDQQVGIGRALEPFDVQHWKEDRHNDDALHQAQPSQNFRNMTWFMFMHLSMSANQCWWPRPEILKPLAKAIGVQAMTSFLRIGYQVIYFHHYLGGNDHRDYG